MIVPAKATDLNRGWAGLLRFPHKSWTQCIPTNSSSLDIAQMDFVCHYEEILTMNDLLYLLSDFTCRTVANFMHISFHCATSSVFEFQQPIPDINQCMGHTLHLVHCVVWSVTWIVVPTYKATALLLWGGNLARVHPPTSNLMYKM